MLGREPFLLQDTKFFSYVCKICHSAFKHSWQVRETEYVTIDNLSLYKISKERGDISLMA